MRRHRITRPHPGPAAGTGRVGAVLLTAVLATAGCSSSSTGSGSSSPSGGSSTRATVGGANTTLTVFAAASLKEGFTQIAQQYQASHPGTTVRFNFGGSATLAQQINQGAPADVFAAASASTMETARTSGHATRPVTFARNVLEIAVPPGNPGKVSGLADLARPSLRLALCQQDVPCGAASQEVLQKARLGATPDTWEPDVKSVLTKVELGEVDAGMVYVTDVRAAGSKVTGIAIPSGQNVDTSYPISTLDSSQHAAAAQDFVDYVTSSSGRAVLAHDGFLAP